MSLDYEKFINEDIYNLASKVGSIASVRNVDKSQVANILSTFESTSNPVDALRLTVTFIARQIMRGEIPRDLGFQLIKDLKDIHDKFSTEGDKLKAATTKYLYLFKWIFESKPRIIVNNFEDFLNAIIGAR
ncbi:MAG: hypothetical protein QXO99_08605 [Candidatus Methanomethylicia archaeon]